MKVSVVDVSANQKKLQVEIPAENVQKEIEKKYRTLTKQVRIKGFRPGKVPRPILKSYYGKAVEGEVSNELIHETFPNALTQSELKPLVEADVSDMRFEDSGAFTYEAILEVCPPFEVEKYKGIEVRKPAVQIANEQVDQELERTRQQHSKLEPLEEERPIREGDVAVVDFTPSVDGVVFEKGKTTDYMLEVGKKAMHPDFDEKLIGRKAGEAFSFDLDYPEDAGVAEIAGKTVHFDVTVKSVKEKVLPELDEEFAKKLGAYETVEALREATRERLQKQEETRISGEVRQQIKEQILNEVKFDLSPKVIEREADALLAQFTHQFESQGLKIDTSAFNTPEIREEYRGQAEKSLRWRLILGEIAKKEDIDITDEEVEEIYKELARLLRKDVSTVKSMYADSAVFEQMKDSKIQEKVFKLLEQEASYTEVDAAEEVGSQQE
jgi:trigger factor